MVRKRTAPPKWSQPSCPLRFAQRTQQQWIDRIRRQHDRSADLVVWLHHRYPETVRWAARRGAKLVFHPHCTGSDRTGVRLTEWGAAEAPYYEKAMMMRSIENTIYFASVNCAMRYQDSATSLVGPDGECLAHVPYGCEQLLVHDVDLARATGLSARRYNPAFYPPA